MAAWSEADQDYKQFHKLSPEWAWKFTLLKALTLCWQGKSTEALNLMSAEPSPPTEGELAVRRLSLQGFVYASKADVEEANRRFSQADALCATSTYKACGNLASYRGLLEMGTGNYSQAQSLFERALKSAHASGDQFVEANVDMNLSSVTEEQSHLDEAVEWGEKALLISIKEGFGGITESAVGNVGWAYYKLGDPEQAMAKFEQAGEQAKKFGARGDEVKWLTAEAYIHMDAQDYKAAEEAFAQSLKLARQINSPEDIVNSLMSLAFVDEQTGKLDEAKGYAEKALAMAQKGGNRHDAVYPLLVEGRLAAREHNVSGAENYFQQVADSKDSPVFLKWEAERSLARLYEEGNRADAADREYRTALSTFEEARCGLHERVESRLPFLSNAARIYEDYIHFLVTQSRENDALQAADYTRARTLEEGLGRACKPTFAPDQLHTTDIARRAGGTILFYALGQDHSYLWTITPREVKLFPLAANRKEIDEAVQRYRKKLEGPRETLEASNDGSLLYQMLVAPAQDFLKKEMPAEKGNIFIVPDGGLNSLNFETLVPETSKPERKRYWIEDVTIANAASLRRLPAAEWVRGGLAGKLLMVGNANVPDPAYPALPRTAEQMENVEKYFPRERQVILQKEQASPQAYLHSHPEQFSYIHFAAHGLANRLNPLDSAVVLSREPAGNGPVVQDESFKLYARAIIGTPALHAELVTISACKSNGERTYSGEGLVGLSWAFLSKGAHNVVGALWDVSDASTPQIMDEFYGGLKKGKSPGAALRAAKLKLLHESDYKSPFYWAPFQLYTGS